MMNSDQYHLCKIAEECAEVSQRALKAMQFGLDEFQPGQDKDNLERLVEEFEDLLITFENFMMLMEHYHWAPSGRFSADRRHERLEKMAKFLHLSKTLNQIADEVQI
jgi:hypothetical protein